MFRLKAALALIKSLKSDIKKHRSTTITCRHALLVELIQAEANIETAIAIMKKEL